MKRLTFISAPLITAMRQVEEAAEPFPLFFRWECCDGKSDEVLVSAIATTFSKASDQRGVRRCGIIESNLTQ